ncbi:MAG TPA: SPASM domain-containing protein [Chitinophagaceae bacterium]|nr:SPASM domain-containing protein [Chitinophagaceae bacterium]
MPPFNRNDTWNILSGLTPRKAWNAGKVLSSYWFSKWRKKPVQWGYPLAVSIEPTTSCNLRCPECPSGLRAFTRPTGMLDKSFFSKTIDELSSHLLYLTFYFQGEPYLNPEFLDMVNYASRRGIYTSTSTNAHFLTPENAQKTIESGLDRLIISIDGTTQETYQSYRVGGQLEKVIQGAKNIVEWKKKCKSKTPFVFFQFLVVKHNEHQIEDIRKLARETGVDQVRFKTAQVYNYKQGNPLIPTISRYSRYRQQGDGTYSIKNKMANHCWKLWHAPVITWDGMVVPCCFDKDASHRLGNLKEMSFRELWQGPAYQHFRQQLIGGRANIDICANCSEGTRVWG